MEKENPNEIAELVIEKYIQVKSYHFVTETARFLENIALTNCILPINDV